MAYFISIDGSYSTLHLALWHKQTCITYHKQTTGSTSAQLIMLIDQLLQTANIPLNQLSYIAANHGPGAFISLRVVLATVNGINFARQIPLIGVDGLEMVHHAAQELITSSANKRVLIASLLNAYGNDVYALLQYADHTDYILKDCININKLIAHLAEHYAHETILFIGNGADLHAGLINAHHKTSWRIAPLLSAESVSKQIGLYAYRQWCDGEIMQGPLQPFYLKSQLFAVRS